MKKVLLFISLIVTTTALSQVGIGNENPHASLDISANETNPGNNEGILIPRISTFPSTNPTATQHSMLVFLNEEIVATNNGTTTTYTPGFYYWNNDLSSWVKIKTSQTTDFRKMEDSIIPTNIEDNIYRQGMVSLGEVNDKAQLSSIVNNSSNNLTAKPKIALYLRNSHPSTGQSYHTFGIDLVNESSVNGQTYGIRTKNSTSTQNNKYGIYNQVTAPGSGTHIGIHNETSQNGTSTEEVYGLKNIVNRTYGIDSPKYGIYSEIGSNTSAGPIFGIYSKAEGDGDSPVYAGYFLGNVAIGTTADNNYILPESRGDAGDVLVVGSNGETQWQSQAPVSASTSTIQFTTIDETTETFVLTEEMSTLRITGEISEISFPNPSYSSGKTYTIIQTSNLMPTNLTVAGQGTIHDDVSDSEITEIHSNERLKFQSDGINWYIIGN